MNSTPFWLRKAIRPEQVSPTERDNETLSKIIDEAPVEAPHIELPQEYFGNSNYSPSPVTEELEVGSTVSTRYLRGGIITKKERNGEEWRYWVLIPGNDRPVHFPAASLTKAVPYAELFERVEQLEAQAQLLPRANELLRAEIVVLNRELSSKRYKKDRTARKAWNAALEAALDALSQGGYGKLGPSHIVKSLKEKK